MCEAHTDCAGGLCLGGHCQDAFYVAPTARGTGTGATASNAALYTRPALWADVQEALNTRDITVWFVAGTYLAAFSLEGLGHDTHRVTLRGATPGGAIFKGRVATMMNVKGSWNMTIRDLHFRNPTPAYDALGYALILTRAVSGAPSHDVLVTECSWENMPDIIYGGLGIHYKTHHVKVENNTFRNLGKSSGAHFIYAAYGVHHITVRNNTFENCAGDYVRFRDRADVCEASQNMFRSTGAYEREDESKTTFVRLPLFNDCKHTPDGGIKLLPDGGPVRNDAGVILRCADYECFGNDYTFSQNTFEFAPRDGGTPERHAVVISHNGFDPPFQSHLMTAAEGLVLTEGSPMAKRDLLLQETGLDVRRIFVGGNTYVNTDHRIAFSSAANYGAVLPSPGWAGVAEMYDIVAQRDVLTVDFEGSGALDGWTVVDGAGATVTPSATAAGGLQSIRLQDTSATQVAQMRRAVPDLVAGALSVWFRFPQTNRNAYLFWVDGAYWLTARSDGTWGTNAQSFGVTYEANRWHHVELTFDFSAGVYSVWVNGLRVAQDVPVPAGRSMLTGTWTITPGSPGGTGDMWVDDVRLADLTEP